MRPIEVVAAIWREFPHGGVEVVLRFFHPGFVWQLPDGTLIEGHDGLRTYFGGLEEQGVDVHVAAYDLVEHGDRVLVPGTIRFRTERSLSDEQAFLVYTIEEDLVTGCVWHRDRAAALEALDLAGQ